MSRSLFGSLSTEIRAAAVAVQFLTRVPVPMYQSPTPEDLRRCVVYFPLVGAAIGCATAGVFALGRCWWPAWLAFLLAMGLEALLTGAFHEDAVADFCDAFGGGWTREQILEILKDSRHGTYGVVGLYLTLSLRWGGTVALEGGAQVFGIIAAATLGRAMILLSMARSGPAPQRHSLSKDLARQVQSPELLAAALLTLPVWVAWLAWYPLWFLAAVGVATVATLHLTGFMRAKVGGVTGDGLGTVAGVCQVLTLLVGAALHGP